MDDDIQKTISEFSSVLRLFPGVNVISAKKHKDNISIELSIRQIESLGPIVYAADGVNVPLNIWSKAPRDPTSERSNPEHLCFEISVKNSNSDQYSPLQAFQFFGVFLVWYLHEVGSMAKIEANRLLSMWNGALVNT